MTIEPTKTEVMHLQPGDVVLITVSAHASRDQRLNILQQFKDATGFEKVLVMKEGYSVQILRKADPDIRTMDDCNLGVR